MKKITKTFIITGVVIFLVLFGISQYKTLKVTTSPIYTSVYKSKSGAVMTMGGMASDKEKIDLFKKDLEQDDDFWEYLDKSDKYTKNGEYLNAIEELKKATSIYPGDHTPHTRLTNLYEKIGQYDLAIKEYDWVIRYQEEAMKDSAKRGYKLDTERRRKLVDELKAERKRVEELIR